MMYVHLPKRYGGDLGKASKRAREIEDEFDALTQRERSLSAEQTYWTSEVERLEGELVRAFEQEELAVTPSGAPVPAGEGSKRIHGELAKARRKADQP